MSKKLILLAVLLFASLALSACSFNWPWQDKDSGDGSVITETNTGENTEDNKLIDGTHQINKFSNYDELKEFIKSKNSGGSSYYRSRNTRSFQEEDVPVFSQDSFGSTSGLSGSLGSESSSAKSSGDYSRTNIQVEGVDEADVIKTDGKYIYLLSKDNLFIIDALPATELKIISTISFDTRPTEIYLDGNRLVVISVGESPNSTADEEYRRMPWDYSDFTYIDIFDTSNIKEPKKIRNLVFEGYYISSRAIDGKLYLISNKDNLDEESILPIVFDEKTILTNDCSLSSKCYAPDVYYFNNDYSYYTLTAINSIDIRNEGNIISSQAYLVSSENFNIYSSLNNIYLTYSDIANIELLFVSELIKYLKPKLDPVTRETLEKIEAENSDNFEKLIEESIDIITDYAENLNEEETALLEMEVMKGAQDFLIRESDNIEKTMIHKLSLNKGLVSYERSASVSGQTLNQFSLDEDENGNLRIATTNTMIGDFGSDEVDTPSSYSNLFVLSPSLEIIGSVTKLAENERIYSARFLGKRAYLVTFEIIDPLFVIDLSNPNKPELLGELKVPGYSTYLHPYDENTLIGLGRDTSLSEWGGVVDQGIKLSLLDVKDPTNPRELDSIISGAKGSDSLALYNHKAFLFSKEKNLLLIPAFLRDLIDENGNKSSIGGAMVFSIDNYKFNLRGIIDHSDNGTSSERDYWCGEVCYDNTVQRGLYINDVVYTFSNKYLKSNDLKNLQILNSLSLTTGDEKVAERDRKRVSDVKQIQIALEMYYNEKGHYPLTEEISTEKAIKANGNVFLSTIPTPPAQVDGDNCPKNQTAYTYTSQGTPPQSYTVNYCLGQDQGFIKGNRLQTVTPAGITL